MKQVTMESVKQRIADLERADNTFGLGLNTEFELACLRELVAVTAQRDAVVSENAVLNAAAKKVIKMNRQHAKDRHGNPDIAESWACVKVLRKARLTPATDSTIASLRAEGVDMAVSHLIEKFNGTGIGVPVMALEHLARQLRESKGANHA